MAPKESAHFERKMLLFFSFPGFFHSFILTGHGGEKVRGPPRGEDLKRHPAAFHLLQSDCIRDSESESVGFHSFVKE